MLFVISLQMVELMPGSGIFIHKEMYSDVVKKQKDGRPDGKAMARYLMSCFWRQVPTMQSILHVEHKTDVEKDKVKFSS
jgi:hypothetical protein